MVDVGARGTSIIFAALVGASTAALIWRFIHRERRDSSDPFTTGTKLLVTGGAGFVLSNLVHEFLASDPDAVAVIFDQSRAWDLTVQQFLAEYLHGGRLRFFDGSVTNPVDWERLMRDHGSFTHVVSGAAITPSFDEEKQSPLRILDVNFLGTMRCIEWVRLNCPDLHRFIHISSDAVLGVQGLVLPCPDVAEVSDNELVASRRIPPMSLYAASKVGGEASVSRYRELYGMDIVTVRFSDVYGRLDRKTGARNRHNAPYWLCTKAVEADMTKPIVYRIQGNSLDEHCWDIVDAPSVARGLTAILQSPTRPSRSVYHLALGRTPTHREVCDAVKSALGPEAQIQAEFVSPQDDPGNSQMAAVLGQVDLSSLEADHWLHRFPMQAQWMQQEFGWKPTPLRQALSEYIEFLQS